MKLSHLLTLNAVLALGFGIAFTVYGPLMAALFGLPELPGEDVLLYWNAVSFFRLFGAALFGLGILLWAVRSLADQPALPPEARRGIVFALAIGNGLAVFVAGIQQAGVWQGAAGWIMAGIFALLTLGYGYFMIKT